MKINGREMEQPSPKVTLCANHLLNLAWDRCTPGCESWCRVGRGFTERLGRVPIPAEIKRLPVSRQRKRQLALVKLGRCQICGDPLYSAVYCLFHQVQTRERDRRRKELKDRYWNADSYRGEGENMGRLK